MASVAATSFAGSISTFSDRTTFNGAAGGSLTIEDFTTTSHFPISTGVLNSQTNLPSIGILPGDIEAGVTYSTAIGISNFFNLDAGGGYTGGFLDGRGTGDLNIKFTGTDPNVARSVSAFGFDMGSLIGRDTTVSEVTISFLTDPDQVFNLAYPGTIEFFGFVSDASDITSVVVSHNDESSFSFEMDNFTFQTVPSPSSLSLLAVCGLVANRRRR